MNFLNPTAFWLLVTVPPVVLFFILRVRLRREPVSTMIFWGEVFRQRPSRALWRRLRYFISLLLSLLFLAVVIAAALDPVPAGTKPRRTIYLVDNSASMNAVEKPNGPTRLDEAKKRLRALLAESERGESAILVCGGMARTLLGWTGELRTKLRAVEKIEPTRQSADLVGAVRLAREMKRDDSDARIVLLTDGCSSGADELAKFSDVEIMPVSRPLDNAGILRFAPRRSFSESAEFETLIVAANFSDAPLDARLELTLDGVPLDAAPLTLPPGKIVTRVLTGASETGGELRARLKILEGSFFDALPSDNEAAATLSARPIQRILCFGEIDYFTLNALAAQDRVQLERIERIPEKLAPDEALVLGGTLPESLPKGNVLLVNPMGNAPYLSVGEKLDAPIIGTQESGEAILRFVPLENIPVPGARELTWRGFNSEKKGAADGVRAVSLAATPERAPILLKIEGKERRIFILSADLEKGDFALRTQFPILAANALAWFRNDSDDFSEGRTIDRAESDLRKTAPAASRSPTPETRRFCARPPRFLLIALAIFLAALEWHLYQRRWIE